MTNYSVVECGGVLVGSFTFTSPNFPNNYPNNVTCIWSIVVPSGRIVLIFNELDIEDQYGNNQQSCIDSIIVSKASPHCCKS